MQPAVTGACGSIGFVGQPLQAVHEDAAQQARHRIDGWKQGFRLDKKLQVKFERKEQEGEPVDSPAIAPKTAKAGAKGKAKERAISKAGGGGRWHTNSIDRPPRFF
jgi:hypothetical protein